MRITRRHALLVAAGTSLDGVAAEPGYEWRPWPARRRAPRLELDTLDGRRWRIADERGRVVLVNFWATWCAPCRDEMPSLARLSAKRSGDGLAVVAANYREGAPAIERFFERLFERPGLALPVVLDRDGAAAAAWTPRIFPSTVVFDRGGRPVGVLVGEIDWEGSVALGLIEPLLAAPAPRRL